MKIAATILLFVIIGTPIMVLTMYLTALYIEKDVNQWQYLEIAITSAMLSAAGGLSFAVQRKRKRKP